MTQTERETFIYELITRAKAQILAKCDKMPEEWDGHELRRFIADYFRECDLGLCSRDRRDVNKKRRRAYENFVLINNL